MQYFTPLSKYLTHHSHISTGKASAMVALFVSLQARRLHWPSIQERRERVVWKGSLPAKGSKDLFVVVSSDLALTNERENILFVAIDVVVNAKGAHSQLCDILRPVT